MKILVRAFAPGTPTDNVGDAIGPWIARYMGYEVEVVDPNDDSAREERAYLLCGSILSRAGPNDISVGCGLGSAADARRVVRHDCRWVRGPFTALHATVEAGLRIQNPYEWCDTAMLLPRFCKGRWGGDPYGPVGLIPHYADFDAYCRQRDLVGAQRDTMVIDTRQPVSDFVADVTSCSRILSGSLHGLVVAHAYGMRAEWCFFGNGAHGDGIKYRDHSRCWGSAASGPYYPRPPVEVVRFDRLLEEALP